jgi:ribose transport system substrate-binding protein
MISKKNKVYILSSVVFIFLILCCIFFFVFIEKSFSTSNKSELEEDTSNTKHLVMIGRYENEAFLKKIYEGALNWKKDFDFELDFYVPKSQAEEVSLQNLFDYASFVNADGIIAYIDSTDEKITVKEDVDRNQIPLITTGVYNPDMQQVSYIGYSYWELGKKISDEACSLLPEGGQIYLLKKDDSYSLNFANFINSFENAMENHKNISYKIVDDLEYRDLVFQSQKESGIKNLIISLSEEDTTRIAQKMLENSFDNSKDFWIIGFGANEACQLYLNNGVVYELISLDGEKIGELLIKEFFEYFNSGYANSYIAADVSIKRSSDENR